MTLSLVQTQHDILIVARRINLFVEIHGVFGCRVVEQRLEGIHLLAVVLDGVINHLPLKLADVGPGVQLPQIHGSLYGEIVCPDSSADKEHE